MKCKSASDLKGSCSKLNKLDFPREGTKTREVYDLFQNNKGVILNVNYKYLENCVPYLVNFYGLDIRNFGHGKWCLVGEWFGSTYIDYLVDKIKPTKVRK